MSNVNISNNKSNNDLNNDLNNKLTINSEKVLEDSKILKNKKTDSCQELKNIAYKTMLQNGNNNFIKESKNVSNNEKISNFLENESHANKNEIWSKLDKTQKIMKLNNYVDNILKIKYNLSEANCNNAKIYLQKCIERKNLQKTKDIIYNKEKNIIENIPYLHYIESNNSFILRKDDKHVSTIKSLPPDKKSKIKTLKIHEIDE